METCLQTRKSWRSRRKHKKNGSQVKSMVTWEAYFVGLLAAPLGFKKCICLVSQRHWKSSAWQGGLPTASTNTENMATQRSDRPQTQKKKKRPAWDLQTHWLSRYWHTGGRSIALPALKSMRALASNLYVPQPLVHADKGRSWRTSTAPVKGDQEMQVSSEGLLRQLLRIHK